MNLFSTYLHHVNNKELSDSLKGHCDQILSEVQPHKDYPIGRTSYFDNTLRKNYQETFLPFTDFVYEQTLEYLKVLDVKQNEINISLVDWWVSDMQKHGSHDSHTHTPGSVISGNFYIDIDPGSSQINFYDADADHNILADLPFNSYNCYNSAIWNVPPKEGLLLMWPANLRHGVETNMTNKRIAISFNVNVTKK